MILGRDSVWQIVSLILDFIKGRGQRPDHSNQVILPRIEKKLLDRSSEKWVDHVADDWQRSIPAYLEYFLEPIQIRKRNRMRPYSITRWI